MPDSFSSTNPAALASFVGKHIIYTYANGWQYETYLKTERSIDYRVHGGPVAGRWVKDQEAHIVRLADQVVKASWTEATGTSVSVAHNLAELRSHGVIFFPQWVMLEPARIALYQNDHLDLMRTYRDAGPTYPIAVIDEFATITFIEDRGPGDETVIACAPRDLPVGYADRRNVG